jgi:hypothetical protein
MASALWSLRQERIRAALKVVKDEVRASLKGLEEYALHGKTSAVVVKSSVQLSMFPSLVAREALRAFVKEKEDWLGAKYTLEDEGTVLRMNWSEACPEADAKDAVWETLSLKITNAREELLETRAIKIVEALGEMLKQASGNETNYIGPELVHLKLGTLNDLNQLLYFHLDAESLEIYIEGHNEDKVGLPLTYEDGKLYAIIDES